jgi:hypothetical protein
MKEWFKKITGVADIEAAALAAEAKRLKEEEKIKELEELRLAAEKETTDALRAAELAKMNPKDRATAKGEPYISVLDTKVNPENVRNGFFELDWNELFIQELILNGYGTDADPQEEIVDRWFRDIVYQMLSDEGLDTSRGSGYINVVPISKGKSEVS